jgi:hypothetical protein
VTSIVVRWAAPASATESSLYRIERSLDGEIWVELGVQNATPPYASPSSTLYDNVTYGAPTIRLNQASLFDASGFAWLDDALVQWNEKNGDELGQCVWHSGGGTYASGSVIVVAHESYSDGAELVNNGAIYRVTHMDRDGNESAPLIQWYYAPPKPASSQHCVVIVNVGADLGILPQAGVSVQAYLASDNQFGLVAGQHLDANAGTANTTTTNALGLAFFHCWKDAARYGAAGAADAAYLFVLKPGTGQLVVTAEAIPDDRDWVLLSQIATAAGSSRSYM